MERLKPNFVILAAGFWDDSTSHHISVHKPSNVTKSNSTSAMTAAVTKPQSKQTKAKPKKEETVSNKTSNGPATEEFTAWCAKALANINSIVDSKYLIVLEENSSQTFPSISKYVLGS